MKEWTFKVFIKSNGRDALEEWLLGQDAEAEERIRARFQFMLIDNNFWKRPYFDKLQGHKYIHEIIIKTKNKQFRPLGCFGPGIQEFTLLVGASKKGRI